MTTSKKIKKFLFSLFKIKAFNLPVIVLCKFLKLFAPGKITTFFVRFPVNGKVHINMKNAKPFVMVNDGSDTIANEIYWKGISAYEPQTENIILKLLPNADIFFDIGANTGLYSLIAASQSPNIQVHSFEPVDSAYNLFNKSKSANNLNNIVLSKIALSDFDGESTFNLQLNATGVPVSSSLRQDMGDQKNKLIIKVETQMLDTYVEVNGITKIDFMKIDTEGTEDKVLRGAKNVLEKFRPVFVCEVLAYTNIEEKLISIMNGRSYNYYFLQDNLLEQVEKIVGDPYVVSNYLFVPIEKANRFLNNIPVTKIKEKIFN